jgi:hypothetical protein
MSSFAQLATAEKEPEARRDLTARSSTSRAPVGEPGGEFLPRSFGCAPGEASDDGSVRLLNSSFIGRGSNSTIRVAALKRAQQNHGNRFVQHALSQRIIHREFSRGGGCEKSGAENEASFESLPGSSKESCRPKAADVTEGSPEETALAAKVETIDQAMVLLEREVGAAVQGRLGITRNYTGELQTARGRIGGIRELQEGKPGYGEMMRQCDEMANEVGDIQGQFDLIQRDLELAGQSRQQIDAYNAKATSLLQRIDELNKKLGGVEREQKSQLQALGEGAELYGKTDEENRQRLGDRQGRSREQMADEKISDLIAKKRDGSWLVTESKGGNIGDAETQLRNTIEHLVRAEPGAKGRIQARITITPEAMQRLSSPEGLAGYRVGEAGRLEVGPQGASKPVILPNTTGPVIVQVL